MSKIRKILGIVHHNYYLFSLMSLSEAFMMMLCRFKLSYVLSKDIEWKWCSIQHRQVYKFLCRNYAITPPNKIIAAKHLKDSFRDKIWVLWWQGAENMPKLVRLAYQSIVNNSNGHEVILLSQFNYSSYVDIPQAILDKVEKQKMSYAHFSDFIRLQLLSRYGGLWVDSTVLVLKPIDNELFSYPFYSIHTQPHDNKCVGVYRYFVSLMASRPGEPFMLNCYNIFKEYWMHHDKALDYLFLDYCLDYVASNPDYNTVLPNIPFNNKNVLSLLDNFNSPYSEKLWDELTQDTTFFKLNWKVKAPMQTKEGKETIYGHILNMNL